MASLELKIPPPLVATIVAAGMGAVAWLTPVLALPRPARAIAAALWVVAGLAVSLAGVVEFRRARTTVHPLRPERASALVSGGVYRFTRNPMYVGMAATLVGWAAWLAAPWALLGPLAFVAFITRYQIGPEERVLAGLFGTEYAAYRQRVRRWL
jgi:protein-S-isoprenylcysteine O-methyltransferase Ste14